jgi:hypothetical protein
MPHRGGFLGFHRDEPAVCLTVEGDCSTDFNPSVVLADDPLRVTVEVASLDAGQFAADLNALLDPGMIFIARRQGLDLLDPRSWSFENSIALAGCVRYRAKIPARSLRFTGMRQPDQIQFSAAYGYEWSDGERHELLEVLDRLVQIARSHGGDAPFVDDNYRPLREWALKGE